MLCSLSPVLLRGPVVELEGAFELPRLCGSSLVCVKAAALAVSWLL